MGDVFDLVADLNEHPPTHLILAARYGVKSEKSRSRAANPAPKNDEADTRELTRSLGGAQPVPEDARERARWAKQEQARLAAVTRKKKK